MDERRWKANTCTYRLLCLGILLGFMQFAVGVGLPVWKRDGGVVSGLWQNCSTALTDCEFYSTLTSDGWLDWVRAFEAIAFVSYCVSLFLMCEFNCSKQYSDSVNCDQCVLPTVCIWTGLSGMVGVILYLIYENYSATTFSAGLYMTCVGSAFAIICGLILLCQRPGAKPEDLEYSASQPIYYIRHSVRSPMRSDRIHRTLRVRETDLFY